MAGPENSYWRVPVKVYEGPVSAQVRLEAVIWVAVGLAEPVREMQGPITAVEQ
jgi:hypothetical protein